MNISDLKDQKLPDLKETARKMGLSGFSTMRKKDLIYLILEANAERISGKPATENGTAARQTDQRDERKKRSSNNRQQNKEQKNQRLPENKMEAESHESNPASSKEGDNDNNNNFYNIDQKQQE